MMLIKKLLSREIMRDSRRLYIMYMIDSMVFSNSDEKREGDMSTYNNTHTIMQSHLQVFLRLYRIYNAVHSTPNFIQIMIINCVIK